MKNTTTPAAQFLDGMADDADLTDEEVETEETVVEATPEPTKQEFEKGTWQHTAQQAGILYSRANKAGEKAGVLLWQGATSAIAEWEQDSDSDVNAEGLAATLLVIMGTKRKGDVSKIKKVAVAVRTKGLQTSEFPNLSKAYAEAKRLLDTAVIEEAEDTAADEAITAVTEEAPKTATTLESAIKMALALSGGADEFARATFDAINHGGSENHEAHRAMVRAFAQEAAGRVKAVQAQADADKAKEGAAKAERQEAEKAVKAEAKPKPAAKKVAAKKAAAPKPAPAKAEASDEGAADLDALTEEAPAKPVPAKPKPRRA